MKALFLFLALVSSTALGAGQINCMAPSAACRASQFVLLSNSYLSLDGSAGTPNWGLRYNSAGGLFEIRTNAGTNLTLDGSGNLAVGNEIAAPGLVHSTLAAVAAGTSLANRLTMAGSVTTAPVTLTATGTDANIGVSVVPKGTGALVVGSWSVPTTGKMTLPTGDSSGTPGNATINQPTGKSAFAAAASTVVITNNLVTTATKVFIQLLDADATLVRITVVSGSGSFTVTGNGVATATTKFDWFIVN